MSNPYLYVLKKIVQLSAKTLPVLFLIKIITLIFFVIGNYQHFTNLSVIIIMRIIVSLDSVIIVCCFFSAVSCITVKHSITHTAGEILFILFSAAFSVFTMFSSLLILTVMTG